MTTVTAKTKIDARAASATETAVTINWDNTSLDDIKALATRTIVIAAQSQWRKDGAVPSEVTMDANDYANPTRAPRKPVDVKKALETYIADQINSGKSREAVISELMAAAKFNDATL